MNSILRRLVLLSILITAANSQAASGSKPSYQATPPVGASISTKPNMIHLPAGTPLKKPLVPANFTLLTCQNAGELAPSMLLQTFCQRRELCIGQIDDPTFDSNALARRRSQCMAAMYGGADQQLWDEFGARETGGRGTPLLQDQIRGGSVRVNSEALCACVDALREMSCNDFWIPGGDAYSYNDLEEVLPDEGSGHACTRVLAE